MKKILILSIDGGGIRGIIPGVVLSYIEDRLGGKSIGHYFDLIAGTSTGGILACAYLSGMSATQAVDLYIRHGREIFSKGPLDFGILHPKYKSGPLEKHLHEAFGDRTIDTFIKPSLITCYETDKRQAVFFTSVDAKKDPAQNFRIKDVARATSAAPTYFQPVQIQSVKGETFTCMDGGVFANNPALCTFAEARKINFAVEIGPDKPDKPKATDMIILSLGTGASKRPYTYKFLYDAGAIKLISPLINILMSGSSETVAYILKQVFKTIPDYYRIEFPLVDASGDIDNASVDNVERLRHAAYRYVDENKGLLDTIIQRLIENE